MPTTPLHLLLADDDQDDSYLFKEALEELPVSAMLSTVSDGVQLIQVLSDSETPHPNAIFLDLNMPRKSGLECLIEIKRMDEVRNLPVIIYSTSLNAEVIKVLYENGAHCYIRKPGEFDELKKVLFAAITLIVQDTSARPARDKFLLNP